MSLGRFFWYEYPTDRPQAAQDFYASVVGWNVSVESGYRILKAGERGVGGILEMASGPPPIWLGYIHVDDCDDAAERVVAAGGSIHRPAADIAGVGRFAVVADPDGTLFQLLAPTPADGASLPAADPQSPGLFSWHELYATGGQQRAFAFYSGLFGWETVTEMDMGAMGTYRIFGKDGDQLGGMMDKPADMPRSMWTFYTNVDGIDAAIARLVQAGGEVMMGPHEVPGGSWIVQARDPLGASFALVSQQR